MLARIVVIAQGQGEWSVAWKDGEVLSVGDHDNVYEKVMLELDVEFDYGFADTDWLAEKRRTAVSLKEALANRVQRGKRLMSASDLRKKAAELNLEAEKIEGRYK